jgi:hypothetical protein
LAYLVRLANNFQGDMSRLCQRFLMAISKDKLLQNANLRALEAENARKRPQMLELASHQNCDQTRILRLPTVPSFTMRVRHVEKSAL